MQAAVLENKGKINIRDIEISEKLSHNDVRIKPVSIGICGSDIHYYLEGKIGEFIVDSPMVLGHEVSGIIIEVGSSVKNLKVGDRVCMEPGIPNFMSSQSLHGMYNLDPEVRFWATPPIHGCMRENFIHPSCLTFKMPDQMSFHEGALVEPVAIGVYSVKKAEMNPGDTALIIGAGTIGIVTALAAEASGCSKVFLADVKEDKLDFVNKHYSDKIQTINISKENVTDVISQFSDEGVDIIFEASGNDKAFMNIAETLKPGGCMVLIGMPKEPILLDVISLQVKEIDIKTVFRYVNIYPRAINLIASGKLNVLPLVTKSFSFTDAIKAFDYASSLPEKEIKIMINMESK